MTEAEEILKMATRKASEILKSHNGDPLMAVREGILFGITWQARDSRGFTEQRAEKYRVRGASA